jgi:protein gp37
MSEKSKIAWTDHTFNPWIGCTKVSPGCTNCYAESRDKRWAGGKHWGKGAPRQLTSAKNWDLPLKWNRDAELINEAIRNTDYEPVSEKPGEVLPLVFCASLADWLDDEVPIEWLADLLALIHATPNLIWQLLTKRPENFFSRISDAHTVVAPQAKRWHLGEFPKNVWIGITAEDQQRADERIPKLLEIPAAVRFLSCEPLLGEIDLTRVAPYILNGDESNPGYIDAFSAFCYHPKTCSLKSSGTRPEGISWVITGCESKGKKAGRNAEHYERDALSIIEQCRAAGVPVFNKQMPIDGNVSHEPDEWPEALRAREFPTA